MGNCLDSKISEAEQAKPGKGGNAVLGSTSVDTSLALTSSSDISALSGSGLFSSGLLGGSGGAPPVKISLKAFSYADLKAATGSFRNRNLLGVGGFGSVFKGYIDATTYVPTRTNQGIIVAVKKLNVEGLQGHKEWLAEINFLGDLHHPNLVKLIGFCAEAEHRLLVYEYMPRRSLDNHLFRKENNGETLSWAMRMKIAVHAARGLSYLHTCQRPIIYRDFKSSNILLDNDFNAKLSDFGLAKDGPTGDNTHVTTRIMGTLGYAAPEYVATGRLTSKSDVYGYGVVLLEILTGRRAVDKSKPSGEQNLVDWATPFLNDKSKVLRIMDQKLDGQFSQRGAKAAAALAVHCLRDDAKLRPTMKQILDYLEPICDSRFNSAASISSPFPAPAAATTTTVT